MHVEQVGFLLVRYSPQMISESKRSFNKERFS